MAQYDKIVWLPNRKLLSGELLELQEDTIHRVETAMELAIGAKRGIASLSVVPSLNSVSVTTTIFAFGKAFTLTNQSLTVFTDADSSTVTKEVYAVIREDHITHNDDPSILHPLLQIPTSERINYDITLAHGLVVPADVVGEPDASVLGSYYIPLCRVTGTYATTPTVNTSIYPVRQSSRINYADTASRDAIPLGIRYEGQLAFVQSTGTMYILTGGTANSNWKSLRDVLVTNSSITSEHLALLSKIPLTQGYTIAVNTTNQTVNFVRDGAGIPFIRTEDEFLEGTLTGGTITISGLQLTATNSTYSTSIPAVYTSSAIPLVSCVGTESVAVSWTATTPANTSVLVEASLSTDSGATWSAWTGTTTGTALPGTNLPNTEAVQVRYRVTLSTTDSAATPTLASLTVTAVSNVLMQLSTTGTLKLADDVIAHASDTL